MSYKERVKMKRLLIAPDSFKESMSALEVANAIERGFRRVFNDTWMINKNTYGRWR